MPRNQVVNLTLGLSILILAKTGDSKCTCGLPEELRTKRAGEIDDEDSATRIGSSHDHGDTITDDDELDNLDADLEDLVQRHEADEVLKKVGISKNHGHKMPRGKRKTVSPPKKPIFMSTGFFMNPAFTARYADKNIDKRYARSKRSEIKAKSVDAQEAKDLENWIWATHYFYKKYNLGNKKEIV